MSTTSFCIPISGVAATSSASGLEMTAVTIDTAYGIRFHRNVSGGNGRRIPGYWPALYARARSIDTVTRGLGGLIGFVLLFGLWSWPRATFGLRFRLTFICLGLQSTATCWKNKAVLVRIELVLWIGTKKRDYTQDSRLHMRPLEELDRVTWYFLYNLSCMWYQTLVLCHV